MEVTQQRALSRRQAFNCEMALEPRCRCRCNGAAHGLKRIQAATPADAAPQLAALPPADPHFVAIAEEHPLGPLRKVIEKTERRSYYGARRGRWLLKLECGHTEKRKRSRRPPKQLHCAACRDLAAGICSKCGAPLSSHTKSQQGETVRYYCLQIPRPAAPQSKKAIRAPAPLKPRPAEALRNAHKRRRR